VSYQRLVEVVVASSSLVVLAFLAWMCTGCISLPSDLNNPNTTSTSTSSTDTSTTSSSSTSSTTTTAGLRIAWNMIQWAGGPAREENCRAFLHCAEAFGYGDDPRLLEFVLSNEHVDGDSNGGRLGWVCNDCSCFAWNREDGRYKHLTHYCVKPSSNPDGKLAVYETVIHEQMHSLDDLIPEEDKVMGAGNRGHEQFMRHKTTRELLEVGPTIAVRWPMGVRKPTWDDWLPVYWKGRSDKGWNGTGCGTILDEGT